MRDDGCVVYGWLVGVVLVSDAWPMVGWWRWLIVDLHFEVVVDYSWLLCGDASCRMVYTCYMYDERLPLQDNYV